ncbi:transglutaminase domain-containing protein [Phytoactinopolyspora endophytica]|uniref:transglutaminase domain-containing protein n=1 Tax=Phytoactinopolyspora endophytica TaxID=1642495 RepID=UPI00101D8E29|nr:transglutaminase-like domain-containing protein [Phytoactinopolyspora endophytica]
MVTPTEQLPTPTTLDLYTQPATMTSLARHADLLQGLPHDVAELAKVLQGLVVHEHLTELYGFKLSDKRRQTVHIRPAEQFLERIHAEDGRPLTEPRTPENRVAGCCRHFTVLFVALLRHQGVPARARCGFGGYLSTETFEDHWVAEYFNADHGRWILVDAQIDDVLRGGLPNGFDATDVSRDEFVIAGDAWASCRAGDADPSSFGFSHLNQGGYWWIAGNLLRDVAALNNMEMLPWDVWGAMPGVDQPIDDDQVRLFDRLAALTRSPDAGVDELSSAYHDDERVRVPRTVINAIRLRNEEITSSRTRSDR